MIAPVSDCMSVRKSSGGREAGEWTGGVGVEIEPGAFPALEPEESRTRDHGGVVGRKARRRRKDVHALGRGTEAHRLDQRAVAGDAAAEDDASASMGAHRADSLLA